MKQNILLILIGLVLIGIGLGLYNLIEDVSIWILMFPLSSGSGLVAYCSLNLVFYDILRVKNGVY